MSVPDTAATPEESDKAATKAAAGGELPEWNARSVPTPLPACLTAALPTCHLHHPSRSNSLPD